MLTYLYSERRIQMKFKVGDLVKVSCDLKPNTFVRNFFWNEEKQFYNGYIFKVVRIFDNERAYFLDLSKEIEYPKRIIRKQDDFQYKIYGWSFLEEWLIKVPSPTLVKFLRSLKNEI